MPKISNNADLIKQLKKEIIYAEYTGQHIAVLYIIIKEKSNLFNNKQQ